MTEPSIVSQAAPSTAAIEKTSPKLSLKELVKAFERAASEYDFVIRAITQGHQERARLRNQIQQLLAVESDGNEKDDSESDNSAPQTTSAALQRELQALEADIPKMYEMEDKIYNSSEGVILQHSLVDAAYPQEVYTKERRAEVPFPLPCVPRGMYQDFYAAEALHVVLQPGDVLFIPSYWWHWVFSEADSIGANFFFVDKNAADDCSWEKIDERISASNSKGGDVQQRSVVIEPVETKADDGALNNYGRKARVFREVISQAERDEPHLRMASLKKEFEFCRESSEPIFASGCFSHWPALGWDINKVLNSPACKLQRFVVSPTGSTALSPVDKPHPGGADNGININGDAADCKKYIEDNPNHSVQFTVMMRPSDGKDLFDGIRIPPFFDPVSVASINLWCNTKPLHTGLHFDKYSNAIVQLVGCKRILLYPPGETSKLYLSELPLRSIKAVQSKHKTVRSLLDE